MTKIKRAFVLFLLLSAPAFAVTPDEILADPVLESRARAITKDLRCVVCQGQSVDDSDAGVAGDLRRAVRARLQTGATDDEVRAFLRARYGDVILMRPPMDGRTALLWIGPGAILGLGLLAAWRLTRRTGEAP